MCMRLYSNLLPGVSSLPVHCGNEAGDVCEKLDDSAAVKYLTVGNNVCSVFLFRLSLRRLKRSMANRMKRKDR